MTKPGNNSLCIFKILKSGFGSCTLSSLLSVTKLELHAFQLGRYRAKVLEFQAPVLWLAVALGPGSKWRNPFTLQASKDALSPSNLVLFGGGA